MEKKTRNRRPKPKLFLSGIRLDNWRDDPARVNWANTDPIFREVVSVLTNERTTAADSHLPLSENCRLGRLEGYEKALEVLHLMTQAPPLPERSEGKPTYEPEIQEVEHI